MCAITTYSGTGCFPFSVVKSAGDAPYQILDNDKFDLITVAPTVARTVTLPTLAANQGRVITVMNITGTDVVTLDGEGAEEINGNITQPLVSKYNYITVLGIASEWIILAKKQSYETAYININDWTNAELAVAHNLNIPLSNLIIQLVISTDGTDANSFMIIDNVRIVQSGDNVYGLSIFQVDLNNIKIQTATNGIRYIADDGTQIVIAVQNWHYKIVVEKR